MKKALVVLFITALTVNCLAQQKPNWDSWNWLLGTWVGEGNGQPGQGSGTFTFDLELNKNIMVRKSHTEFPETERSPKIIHDDLLIVYAEGPGSVFKAIYFDNESHIIKYTVSVSDKEIVMVSDKVANIPVFRLTYSPVDKETVNTRFEMSQDGKNFNTYLEGKSRKVK